MQDGLEQALGKLNYAELKTLQEDLHMSVPLSKHLVDKRIEELETSAGICAVCGTPMKDSPNNFVLIFGPVGVRKKSSICAIDCLEYFVKKLKTKSVMSTSV